MPICPHCHQSLHHFDLRGEDKVCPQCDQSTLISPAPWRDAARVTSLAEGGYLASRLDGEGIATRLVESSSFSAVDGMWRSAYLLQVHPDDFARAQPLLVKEAAEAELEEPDLHPAGEPFEEESVQLVIWRPVALMALAGIATLWIGARQFAERPPAGPHRSSEELAEVVGSIGKPFVVVDQGGRAEHRLWYQRAERTWYLQSDTDGDGRMDTLRPFRMAPLPAP